LVEVAALKDKNKPEKEDYVAFVFDPKFKNVIIPLYL